jgi:FMN phosphatase YigB (HAD superfamily)
VFKLPSQTRAVLFDFYDTLVEVDRDAPSMAEMLTSLGFHCSSRMEGLYNSDGHNGTPTPMGSHYEGWRTAQIMELCGMAGVPRSQREAIAGELLAADRSWTVKSRPGAFEVLTLLDSNGILTAIASNWDYEIEPYLAQAGLNEQIPSVLSWEVGARKPDPTVLVEACRMLGVHPSEAVYVGDNWETDVRAAIRAGVKPVWLCEQSGSADSGPIVAISSLSEVTSWL